jgi:hypothetical protein
MVAIDSNSLASLSAHDDSISTMTAFRPNPANTRTPSALANRSASCRANLSRRARSVREIVYLISCSEKQLLPLVIEDETRELGGIQHISLLEADQQTAGSVGLHIIAANARNTLCPGVNWTAAVPNAMLFSEASDVGGDAACWKSLDVLRNNERSNGGRARR